jgi:hypothetical protein
MAFNYPTEADLADKSRRAGERFNNPFNMWFDKYANDVGGLQGRQITQYDTPSVFPSKILGASAAIRKMAESPLYSGKTMQDLIGTWVGHGESYAPIISQATGIPTSTRITPQFLQSPDGMRFLQTMARYETQWEKPYPLTRKDWETARRIAFDPEFRSQYVTAQGGSASPATTLAGAAAPPSSSPVNLPTSGGALADNSGNPIAPRVVAQAEKLAVSGNIPGVQQFVRSQGYNVDPNWCGEFTGAVIKSAGGTPPEHGEVASSWLNWGTHVDPQNMQPGDVAVYSVGTYGERKGQPLSPGDLGGHVGIVGSGGYDPKTGTFNMVDNHGQPHLLSTNNLEFRRAPAGATTMADQTGGDEKQGPGYGPPVPPGNIVQNGQMYAPMRSGTGDAAQGGPKGKGGTSGPTAMSQRGGAPYIPILSEIGAMFGGGYPGRPGLKGGYMQPTQAGTQAQAYNPGATVPVGPELPVGPRAPAIGNVPTPVARPTAAPQPSVTPGPFMQPSVFNPPAQPSGQPGALSPATPSLAPSSKFPPVPWPAGGPATNVSPPSPSATAPSATGPTVTPRSMGGATFPAGQQSTLRSPALLNVLNAMAPVSSANASELPPGPSATAAVQGASGLPQAASFAERFAGAPGGPGAGQYSNPALAAALGASPQPSFPGGVPMPRANPIAGTQTALTIPPRGPWPPAPPMPQQQPGMTIAGIPLPRPRPQMPGTPPPQIPQPGTIPQPAAVPRPNMPMPGAPGVPPFPPDIARTNATSGPLGGTQMPPGATGGVRLLDAVPPQTTSQGGPVPPPTPSQTASPAQILADQMTNSPAIGMVPTSSGDAGAPAVTRGLSPLARPPMAVPNASSFADRFQASQPAQDQDAVNAALLEYLRQQAQLALGLPPSQAGMV